MLLQMDRNQSNKRKIKKEQKEQKYTTHLFSTLDHFKLVQTHTETVQAVVAQAQPRFLYLMEIFISLIHFVRPKEYRKEVQQQI